MSRTVRKAIGLLVALIVSVATMVCLMALIVKSGLCSEDILKECINESDYFEQKLDQANEVLVTRTVAIGLPESVTEGVITDRMIAVDSDTVIRAMLKDEQYVVDTSSMKERFYANINAYYEELGISPDDELSKATEMLVDTAAVDYVSRLPFEYARYYADYAKKYRKVCDYAIYISIAVILVCMIISLFLHRKKYRGIRYINYGLISGSIIAIIEARLVSDNIADMLSNSEYEYVGVVEQYVRTAFSQGMFICMGGILAFLIMCVITMILRKESI